MCGYLNSVLATVYCVHVHTKNCMITVITHKQDQDAKNKNDEKKTYGASNDFLLLKRSK